MKAGRMDQLLELLEPVGRLNGYGERTLDYEPRHTVHAEEARFSGSRSEEASEHFADYRTAWNIREQYRVTDGWRVRHVGGHLYTVVAVTHNRRRMMRTLICERLNE